MRVNVKIGLLSFCKIWNFGIGNLYKTVRLEFRS